MTNGLERVRAALRGSPAHVERASASHGTPDDATLQAGPVAVVPILHTMSARLAGVPIGRYAADAACMANCLLAAYRRFGYDGIQLSLGVATEAEALGARVHRPTDGLPAVAEPLLQRPEDLARLTLPDMARSHPVPMFAEAVSRVVEAAGQEAWVVATIRGPLLMATQLRGVEAMLIDLLERPAWCADLMAFTTEVGIRLGTALARLGAHAIAIGEATCSPDFISPAMYRAHVHGHHHRLVGALHAGGAEATVMHICGRALPIVPDIAQTGCRVMDIDSQVDPGAALAVAGPMVLRGNIDPAGVLLRGTPQEVREAADAALASASRAAPAGQAPRFILGSGCDVPPDTPPEHIEAMVQCARGHSHSQR